MWKIASTAQFVNAFRELFKLPEIEIQTLEEGFLGKSMYGINILKQLVVAILKSIYPNLGVRLENYEYFLKRVVNKIWITKETLEDNPLKEDPNFENLTPLTKLNIVYSLCLHLLDKATDSRSKWRDQISKMDSDLLRVQPLGSDDDGNEYWYFYGTRLYKQEPAKERKIKDWEEEWNTQKNTCLGKRGRGRPRKIKPRKSDGESEDSEEALANRSKYLNLGEKSRWSVVCNTLDDWVEFAEKLKDSESKCERALFRTITDNFLPVINEAYQAKEKKLQQKLRDLMPKINFTRESRKRRVKAISRSPEIDYENREYLTRSREHRLKERNRRLNESAENASRRRSRSRISPDINYDDFDEEISKSPRNGISYSENSDIDFAETTRNKESIEAKANEIMKDYIPLVSNNSDNKSLVLSVFTQLKLDKNSYPFHYGIDKKEFPDYYDIISVPMDLSRMERKLRMNIYKTAADIDDDFKIMVENCELYFGADSERSIMGRHTWRLFRRLMKNLSATPKQTEKTSAANGIGQKVNHELFKERKTTNVVSTPKQSEKVSVENVIGQKENPKLFKEKKTANVVSKRSERSRKMRKRLNNEALEILSKEAELAVERSQSMDEEHFRNSSQKIKKFTQFSDLKVEPIHSHPSNLIEKLMPNSSNQENNETYCNKSSSTDNHSSEDILPDTSYDHQCLPENMEVNDHESNEKNSNSSQLIVKNPEIFNGISVESGANLEILSDSEMDPHSASNCLSSEFASNNFRDQKSSSDEDFNNFSGASDNPSNTDFTSDLLIEESDGLGTSPSSNSQESYRSHDSNSSDSSVEDLAKYSPHQGESNATFLNGYGYASFTPGNEPTGSSTVDASCLGLASTNISKRHQVENEPKTSVVENISRASLIYNGNQNSYNIFGELNPRSKEFSENQPETRTSNSENRLMQDQFPHQEISKDEAASTIQTQTMQVPLINQVPSKSPLLYSSYSHQFTQGQIENQTHFRQSALSPEQEQHCKSQDLEHSQSLSKCSPSFLSNGKAQDQGNTENQSICSSKFTSNQEVDSLAYSRNHQTCSSASSFQNSTFSKSNTILQQGQCMEEQENVDSQEEHFPSQKEVENHDSAKTDQRYSSASSSSQEMQSQESGSDLTQSHTMHQESQTPLSVNEEHNKNQSKYCAFSSCQEIQGPEMIKSRYYTQPSSFPLATLKDQDPDESQQIHRLNTSHDVTQKQRFTKSQMKSSNISYQNKQVSDQMRFNSYQEVDNRENNSQSMASVTFCTDQNLKNQHSAKNHPLYLNQYISENQPKYSPTLSAHQEINHHQSTKNQLRGSPTLSACQETNHQQQPAKSQSRYSPTLSIHQEMNNQQLANNQSRCSPNASAYQANAKSFVKIHKNSSSCTSQIIDEQESARIHTRYSPTFSNQGVLIQESTKTSVQQMHNESLSLPPGIQNQVPVETSAFDFRNIFSSFNSSNTSTQVTEPSSSANSAMQIPSQVSVSHSNQNHMTKLNFPSVKVQLPPSSGQLIVVPGDPSSMTFHLFAKPVADPSQPIRSSLEIHADNQMRNQDCPENIDVESDCQVPSKNPMKKDTAQAPRKQSSPILGLQHLALNPRKSPTSPSLKNKHFDNSSNSNRSLDPSHKSPPALANASSVLKPNAALVRPLDPVNSSASFMQQHSRNSNSFQQEAFLQQTEALRNVPMIFTKGNSVSTNSVPAVSINVNNGQRSIIPNNLQNALMQNSNGQYVLIPSKDMLLNNVDHNLKVKNSERSPPIYHNNVMQNLSFQNGHLNSVQMLPQVHLPYVNPYYVVTNSSAFQNPSRYPVMNMQSIPFQR
ncbi:Cat eye syndrome critical region protein 2 like protein [Argiope bruennichi]|uniref:Cat eye syndrome critical region protein 2 like protein n=1 Tax=Argiope bruennichi TaxID=94029 RepID=A0A8T0F656_ARGBR|nr:Cat eye syndrome critical region protein 2 like protein [Argiope bruennichi]